MWKKKKQSSLSIQSFASILFELVTEYLTNFQAKLNLSNSEVLLCSEAML